MNKIVIEMKKEMYCTGALGEIMQTMPDLYSSQELLSTLSTIKLIVVSKICMCESCFSVLGVLIYYCGKEQNVSGANLLLP